MPEALFVAKKLLTALVLPPTGPLLLALLGLALMRCYPGTGRAMAWVGTLVLFLLCLPVTSTMLVRAASLAPPGTPVDTADAQAIVILAGGRVVSPEYGGEAISRNTLERIRYGVLLARQRNLPVLVTGGAVFRGTPEAELMARAMSQSFGVQPRWIENRARDTHQNAVYSARLLDAAGVRRIVLVTHDAHQRRAVAEFTRAGLDVTPAPVSFGSHEYDRTWMGHLPNVHSLFTSSMLIYELVAYAVMPSG
jgi:uncharacterized SAM-binding protein YcdF (DUF218 family)